MLIANKQSITVPFFLVKSKLAYFFKVIVSIFRMDVMRFFCAEIFF